MPRLYARAPDHLGDGVMALPAMAALARLGALGIRGPGWAKRLYRGLGELVDDPGAAELAVLFKPAFRAAWEARRVPRRIGLDTDHRRLLLSTALSPGDGHRTQDYAALAAAAGAVVSGEPSLATLPEERDAAPELADDVVLILPGSASGEVVAWPHHRALADLLGRRACFAGGPLEEGWLPGLAGPHRLLPTLPLGVFAAVAARVAAVVSNDSGLAHLAAAARRAAGCDPADVHVIFGSTDPARTGPPGSTAHVGPRPHCAPCYRKRCHHDLSCLEVPVDRLLTALT